MRDGAREPPEGMGQLAGKIITQNICVLEEHKITNEGRPIGGLRLLLPIQLFRYGSSSIPSRRSMVFFTALKMFS